MKVRPSIGPALPIEIGPNDLCKVAIIFMQAAEVAYSLTPNNTAAAIALIEAVEGISFYSNDIPSVCAVLELATIAMKARQQQHKEWMGKRQEQIRKEIKAEISKASIRLVRG